ncbi:MAG: aspartate--tRNA(Asn) ligase [Bdellovibrio sp. CG12_big_fil_rev_8_21_14_0_65_39_13]|nr:MAG: aspartate--tRNA(Asn) ligase [Bdellovibrio sp. CG22_combo_CG10-13_8_21_14_all_39_27]PIQ59808.1 MAG: aspartate--tRNA(Asn) ligase [Bdellovibrio sp. CG12_big_fil_rev_8_21_14_0_65_39_13]PIR36164.1 MAG: aspartate--tRNA(Asn) ligase [Bdellovibrio sp. CG11_big_fil_rev_8_21_14_0_20_39_38]PJB52778.1 MAG: aspartate--tRNA(Asn) ligase [Bdellovibrio sp. CG_4_9_14_3_um_filter_39_7]
MEAFMKSILPAGELNQFFINPESMVDADVDFTGTIYKIKNLGQFSFVHLSTLAGIFQSVITGECSLKEGSSIHVWGKVVTAKLKDKVLASKTIEIQISKWKTLSTHYESSPFDLTKPELNIHNDVLFDQRMISLRHPREKAIFKIQEALGEGFRRALRKRGCTELRTPKIVKEGAEGGANIFELNYFGQPAYLTQSPQFYKEFGVGIFERVFEIAPVFRAEKHNTSRHLNEYISVDAEIGNISSFEEVMAFETGVLKEVFEFLKLECSFELELLGISLKEFESIPSLTFKEVKVIVSREFGIHEENEPDLSPQEELKISEWALSQWGSDFLFVTHYPSEKRPFYAMDSEVNPEESLSFDLLYRGVEITTGGQRIHEYEAIVNKLKRRGMNPEHFEFFIKAHRYGLPPHGGFGLGLERLTQKIIGLESVKRCSLFPRDISRLSP